MKHLTPTTSAQYQRVAAQAAKAEGIARVHLDAVYWSMGMEKKIPAKANFTWSAQVFFVCIAE